MFVIGETDSVSIVNDLSNIISMGHFHLYMDPLRICTSKIVIHTSLKIVCGNFIDTIVYVIPCGLSI